MLQETACQNNRIGQSIKYVNCWLKNQHKQVCGKLVPVILLIMGTLI
jgi:hypothetical protein